MTLLRPGTLINQPNSNKWAAYGGGGAPPSGEAGSPIGLLLALTKAA